MKKVLLFVGGGIALLVAVVLAMGAFQPNTYHVERSVVTTGTPDAVYRIISDFNRFSEWSPWDKMDPNMKKTVEGQPGEVGTSYAWDGNDKVGAGKMTVVSSVPGERIDIKLEFTRPWASTSTTSWIISKEDGNTKMTWSMDGNNDGVIAKTFSMFMDMDAMLGKDFDTGLAQLKTIAESESF